MVKDKKVLRKSSKQKNVTRKHELELHLKREKQWLPEQDSLSSSTTDSTESNLSKRETSEEETDFRDVLDNLYDTDIESLQEEEPEYAQQNVLEEEVDFFDVFGHVPDIDNISEDITVNSILIDKVVSVIDSSKDMGKFVDPLTGDDIQSKASISTNDETAQADFENEFTEEEQEQDTSAESELLLPDDVFVVDDEIAKYDQTEDTFEHFLNLETKQEYITADDIDWEVIAKQEDAKRVQHNIFEFVSGLIDKVVNNCEYVSPEKVLRQNLDKSKLLEEIFDKLPLYGIENNVRQFFNRKVVEYYRRKKSFRAIMQDNPKTLDQDKIKFKDAVRRLDLLLGKESHLRNYTSKAIQELQNKYDNAKKVAETEIQLFKSNIKNSLLRDDRPKTKVLIEQLLTKINRYREEINEVRFMMFIKQHTEAQLTDSLAKLEDLGNGLSMRDFGTLQSETQALGKKIEERNVDLNKLHSRCHSDIHTMAHYKEKQKMLRNAIAVQRSILESLMDEKSSLRKYLHHLKLNHNNVRRQLNDLSFQSGLLDKPTLMFDYDATVARLHRQHETVDNLKSSLAEIQHKIDEIIKLCPTA